MDLVKLIGTLDSKSFIGWRSVHRATHKPRVSRRIQFLCCAPRNGLEFAAVGAGGAAATIARGPHGIE